MSGIRAWPIVGLVAALAVIASGCELAISVDRKLATRQHGDAGTDAGETLDAGEDASLPQDAGHTDKDAGSDAGKLEKDAGHDAGHDAGDTGDDAGGCLDFDQDGVCNDVDVCPTLANADQADADHDGVGDECDACETDPLKVIPGPCGCGTADDDPDGDGFPTCVEFCPQDPSKQQPGVCGCGVPDTDTDSDGFQNCLEQCPTDPTKQVTGICGCGTADTDSDGDGTANCMDLCPLDNPDDSDGDGSCDSSDLCQGDDSFGDSDGDGLCDDIDTCPSDPALSDCSGSCVDLSRDHDHCGNCGTVCSQSELCMAGNCVFVGPPLSFTLTWAEPTADLDLYVSTPSGNLIYYGNTSADGGTMFTDSMSGPGVEQIAWPGTPPSGDYQVCVVAYDVTLDAPFQLDVSETGTSKQSVSGTLTAADSNMSVMTCTSLDADRVLTYTVP